MAFSAWKIWLHPQVTRRVMEAQEEALDAAGVQTSRLEADNASVTLINSELASRLDSLGAELTASHAELAASRAETDRLRDELEDRLDTERQIREFDAVLRRAEDMKRRYETRISRLQGVIRDMKKASGKSDPEADEIAVIDMSVNCSACEKEPGPLRKHHPEDGVMPESDWLENLPE